MRENSEISDVDRNRTTISYMTPPIDKNDPVVRIG
jgi:hypothetical protein